MKTLYYNCPAGLCGDMNLGAMVDLGVDERELLAELAKLGLPGWEITFTRDQRNGVTGTRCDVKCPHEHHHRTFADIRAIIEGSSLDERVKRDAVNSFRVLAEAEGRVHGRPADAVHFHEIGAIDSILDITGAAICWKLLGIDRIAAGTLELGGGTVKCAHGRMPVPAPATARLVEGFPVSVGGASFEATTPTGAALLAGKGCQFGRPVSGTALATGIGIGQRRDPAIANVVYVSLLDCATTTAAGSGEAPEVVELATNLDDMPPERVAFLAERLLEAGALDVWQTPAVFKKGRLGCVLTVLIRPEDRAGATALLFRHSTTLGVRWRVLNRSVLDRQAATLETPLGPVRIKSVAAGGIVRSKLEYDDLSRLARDHDLSITEVEQKIHP